MRWRRSPKQCKPPQATGAGQPVPAQRARLLLAQGDLAGAGQWTQESGLRADDDPDYPREPDHLVLARVLLAQGRAELALPLLDRLHAAAGAQHRTGSLMETGASRPSGRKTLRPAAARSATWPTPTRLRYGSHPGRRRVTRHYRRAAGRPNQAIARELVVSLDKVKKHVGHVLGKLGAANRTEAVARARQLGLIPESALPTPGRIRIRRRAIDALRPASICADRAPMETAPASHRVAGGCRCLCQLQRLISLCGYAANWPLSAPFLRLVR